MTQSDRSSDHADEPTRVIGRAPAAGDAPTVTVPAPASASAAEAGVLPAGSRLAEFEITRLIGQGGFGAVYEAWDHTLERVVAIKEYLPAALSSRLPDGTVQPLSERQRETFDLGMRSFINEARLLAQFDHPSLLKVYRFWQERGTTYMVMPFYRGETLRQTLNAMGGAVTEAWLLRIMDGVTQALAVMHGANCYHRDVAPDNIILLEGSGRPVLLDFGAARRVITDKTQAITVILKPGYAPVEQYAEMPDMAQGAWTDVYALAAVMHVAITGRAPPPSVARLLSDSYAPLAGDPGLRQRFSATLLSAVDAGLAVRPEHRPRSMGALRVALGLSEEGRTTTRPGMAAPVAQKSTAAPKPAPAPAASGSGGGKFVALAVAGLALVAVAAGGWWWIGGSAPDAPPAVVATPSPPPLPPAVETPPPPPPPPPVARTPAESLRSLADGASAGFEVEAKPRQAVVAIGKGKLAFEVRSNREGYVYVYLLSTAGELFMLFPNLLDKHNRIAPGAPLALPRASWPMNSGGPAGVNQFAVVVSERERDFSGSGIQNEGVFSQFPLPVLSALEAARGNGPPPLLGKPVCGQDADCKDAHGVSMFGITEK